MSDAGAYNVRCSCGWKSQHVTAAPGNCASCGAEYRVSPKREKLVTPKLEATRAGWNRRWAREHKGRAVVRCACGGLPFKGDVCACGRKAA